MHRINLLIVEIRTVLVLAHAFGVAGPGLRFSIVGVSFGLRLVTGTAQRRRTRF